MTDSNNEVFMKVVNVLDPLNIQNNINSLDAKNLKVYISKLD